MSVTREIPYFEGNIPRIFAHRGVHGEGIPENSASAFRAATAAGVRYIETDVVGSKDGIAMVCHDRDLARMTRLSGKVRHYTAAELSGIDIGGEGFITMSEALGLFPTVRFNIDVKDDAAITGLIEAIREHDAANRVLVTSFAASRRLAVCDVFPGIATSASTTDFLRIYVRARWGLPTPLPRVDALQIPRQVNGMRTVSSQLVRNYHDLGFEVHVWTVNEESEMRELLSLGVDGIITDRADLALRVVNSLPNL